MADEFDGGDGLEGGGDTGASPAEGRAQEAINARDARLAEIYKLSSSDPKLYRTEAVQNELEALEAEKRDAPSPDKAQDNRDEAAEAADGTAEGTGVPETAEGYVILEIEGHQWDHRQKAEINEFLQEALEGDFTQAQIDIALKALARSNMKLAKASSNDDGRAEETAKQTEQELRKTWGREYQQNRTLANEEAMAIWGNHAPNVANLKLQDGSFLGDNRWFVDGLHKLAGRSASRGALEQTGSTENQSSEDRLNYLYSLQTKNYKEYKTRRVQDEILALESAKQNRGHRR